jgi:hypothetical protein
MVSSSSLPPALRLPLSALMRTTQDHSALGALAASPESFLTSGPRPRFPFSILNRRHHCRRCGDIFCSSHSPHAIPLDQEARFHSEGTLQRACDNCWTDYRGWRAARPSRTNSVTSRDSNETMFTQPVGVPTQNKASEDQQPIGSVAQSVGGNWNWSTF